MLRRRANFTLAVRATFERELQMFTHKFTPLSMYKGASTYDVRKIFGCSSNYAM